jgi:hypothetical protein
MMNREKMYLEELKGNLEKFAGHGHDKVVAVIELVDEELNKIPTLVVPQTGLVGQPVTFTLGKEHDRIFMTIVQEEHMVDIRAKVYFTKEQFDEFAHFIDEHDYDNNNEED